MPAMPEQTESPDALLLRQFLHWVGEGGRTYGAAMEGWRSSCPRLSIWEDALGGGLIRIESRGALDMAHAAVLLTPAGRAVLDQSSRLRTAR
jgi:hypothetical protein